jgi:hypothetical protein
MEITIAVSVAGAVLLRIEFYASFGVGWPSRNFPLIQIRHRENQVKIVPVQNAIFDGKVFETLQVEIRAEGWVFGIFQERTEVHGVLVAVVKLKMQFAGRDETRRFDLHDLWRPRFLFFNRNHFNLRVMISTFTGRR